MIPEQHVFEEMQRRIYLTTAIDAVIAIHIKVSHKIHSKRGETQDFIMGCLNLTKNPAICKLINERMSAAGFKSCTLKGYQIYRNAQLLIL